MGRSLLLVVLVAIIFTLLVPVTGQFCANEQAFTPDNLVKVELDYK